MPSPIPTSGILIFPASNSTALLVGAIFAGGVPFPGFVLSSLRRDLPPISPATPSQGVPISRSLMHSSYTTREMPPYLNTSSLRYPSASLSPVSPAAEGGYARGHSYGPYGDQPAPRISQQQYAAYAPSYRQTAPDAFGRWPKEEEESDERGEGSSRYP